MDGVYYCTSLSFCLFQVHKYSQISYSLFQKFTTNHSRTIIHRSWVGERAVWCRVSVCRVGWQGTTGREICCTPGREALERPCIGVSLHVVCGCVAVSVDTCMCAYISIYYIVDVYKCCVLDCRCRDVRRVTVISPLLSFLLPPFFLPLLPYPLFFSCSLLPPLSSSSPLSLPSPPFPPSFLLLPSSFPPPSPSLPPSLPPSGPCPRMTEWLV